MGILAAQHLHSDAAPGEQFKFMRVSIKTLPYSRLPEPGQWGCERGIRQVLGVAGEPGYPDSNGQEQSQSGALRNSMSQPHGRLEGFSTEGFYRAVRSQPRGKVEVKFLCPEYA